MISFLDGKVVLNHGFKYVGYVIFVLVSKHVWLVGMTFLVMHATFKLIKCHVLAKHTFLACFYIICVYGLIHSTWGALTPFPSLFPIIFSFRSLKYLEDVTEGGLDFLIHPSRVGPQLPRAMTLSRLRTCYEFKYSFLSFLFNKIL